MGRVFEEDMPLFDLTPQHRKYTLTVPGATSWGPLGENRLAWNEDYIAGHITQDGTQFDSLSHMATVTGKPGDLNEVRYYNGHSHAEIGTGRGFTKLGVEHVAAHLYPWHPDRRIAGYERTHAGMHRGSHPIADLHAALQRQGTG